MNLIERNYAIVVIVVLSNQIKIKTNVGRTGPSERAADPQSPMSPDTAPDINIVKQISRDEETWKCLSFGCLKVGRMHDLSMGKNKIFYSQPDFFMPKG